ncbi:hypothetical protein [Coraliomargarita akajimensis]|uniref:Uncharacterized protein n=1 Tax=Coraliomargarita akajimensis (strain DSM 45221 / IAM 15411 / JCM 23193 / KCTC 12865 / 04OKA010-24) TaxID=583355 RepID=D5EKH6_CORAD|nr:hypothetical protein [Coraliomargarita akajimensis]ADE53057.1 hypothetical protein Caka_0028 [Coraliomargarita akajimensis DSM 45221]
MPKHKSKHVKLLNGLRIRKAVFYRFCIAASLLSIVFIALLAIGLLADKQPKQGLQKEAVATESTPTGSDPQVASEPSTIPDSPLVTVLRKHRATVAIEDPESMAMVGSYAAYGATLDIAMFAKKPQLYRQSLVYNTTEINAGYDGRAYWQDMPQSGGQSDRPKDPKELLNDQFLILECSYLTLIWRLDSESLHALSLEEDQMIDGKRHHVIRNDSLLNFPVWHLIDAESGLETARKSQMQAAGATLDVQIRYSYTTVQNENDESSQQLSAYKLIIDGEVSSHAKLDSVHYNKGVMPWMFKNPQVNRTAADL